MSGAAAAVLILLIVAVAVGHSGQSPRKAALNGNKVPLVSSQPLARTSARPVNADGSEASVISYYQHKDGAVARHVKTVSWTGPYLRIYTDLPDSKANSSVAVSLCKTAAQYLEAWRGEKDPIVFIHAKESSNGYPVIANKMSPKDNCGLKPVPR